MRVGGRGERWVWTAIGTFYLGLGLWDWITAGLWIAAIAYIAGAVIYFVFSVIRRLWVNFGFRRGYQAYQDETIQRCTEALGRDMSAQDFFFAEIERATGIVRIPYENGGL